MEFQMPSRSRLRFVDVEGYRSKVGGSTTFQTTRRALDKCDDITHNGDNQILNIESRERTGGLVNGEEYSASGNLQFTRWRNSGYFLSRYEDTSPSGMSGLQSDSWYATELIKRTNPGRPSIQAVVSALELRELPGMLKEAYDIRQNKLFRFISRKAFRRLKIAAKLNLLIQFGILPLLSDLEKLGNFQDLVSARQRELERMRDRGLRRTLTLDILSDIQTQTAPLMGNELVTRIRRVTVKGHIRWYSIAPLPTAPKEMRSLATKAVRGTDLDLDAFYQLMPWSWLLDYFTNLGDYIATVKNVIPCTHSKPSIMVEWDIQSTFDANAITSGSGSKAVTRYLDAGDFRYSHKRRTPTNAAVSANLELLTPQQTSILGSLSIVKLMRNR